MPWPGFTFFTIVRARTWPPGTSNTIFTRAPTGAGSGVAISNPPNPSVATRETDRPPICCQATSIPFGSAARANLRFTLFVSSPRMSPPLCASADGYSVRLPGVTWNWPTGHSFFARNRGRQRRRRNSGRFRFWVEVHSRRVCEPTCSTIHPSTVERQHDTSPFM
jgi:hypothetical protein